MRTAIVLCCLALAACAPTSVQDQRASPIERRSFEIGRTYPEVYRAILSQARKCFHGGYTDERIYVSGDLYYDLKSGHVSVEKHGHTGIEVYMATDITAIDESRSKVDVIVGLKLWEGLAADVEGWSRRTSDRCPPRDFHSPAR